MKPAAILFDMDDLLVRSGPIWRQAEETLLAAIGHTWSLEQSMQYKGMNALDVAATIHRLLQPALPLAECQRILRTALIDGFAGNARAMPGAVELVRRLRDRLPLALASGSPMPAIESALGQLGIADAFDQVISSESVPRGKPHPDVFLAAADALGVPPAQCIVFEDSLVGVQAGLAAGMVVCAVPSGAHEAISRLTPHVYGSLTEVPADFPDAWR